jgi:enamine deaminase RidA (YjgF/YER057c/UK114 family)
MAGYSRAVRIGDRTWRGTTATHGAGEIICPGDVRSQAVYILDKIAASIEALGGALEDVVRTRIYIRDQSNGRAPAYMAAISAARAPRTRWWRSRV